MINFFDLILLLTLSGFVFFGLFFGLIRILGSLLGIALGAFLAGRFYLDFFHLTYKVYFGFDNLGKVMSFIILFSIINRLASFGAYIIDRAFNIISIIPFLKSINRISGAILGLLEGSLFLGVIIYVSAKYSMVETLFGKYLISSKIAPILLKITKIILPLLPDVLKKLKSLI